MVFPARQMVSQNQSQVQWGYWRFPVRWQQGIAGVRRDQAREHNTERLELQHRVRNAHGHDPLDLERHNSVLSNIEFHAGRP